MFIVFGLTRSGLELTIYRTRGEHANHYVTDAVTKSSCFETRINVYTELVLQKNMKPELKCQAKNTTHSFVEVNFNQTATIIHLLIIVE
jgi:hypothetical protein